MKWCPHDVVIRRTMDASFLNRVANDPAVRPWLGGDGELDFSAKIADPKNLAGITEDGGFVAEWIGEGRYEIHSLFLPERSTGPVKAMRGALDYMFSATDAVELVTKVPMDNLAAHGLSQLAGFTTLFSGPMLWSAAGRKAMDVRTMQMQRWALRSTACLCAGRWLHERFAEVIRAHASLLPEHSADDETHDRMAGAAALMLRGGNVAKGVLFYNQWAALAGYPLIRWLRDHPVIVDLEGIIVELTGDQIEVLQCQ